MMRLRNLVVVAAVLPLAGCLSTAPERPTPRQAAPAKAAIPVEALVGSWGIASYREEKDRKRTENMARSHCGRQPYVIRKGPTDGVMMHVSDDSKLYELTTKSGPDGKTYVGFNAPPGHPQDREILSFSDDVITMRYVSPEIHSRYGIYVYVRCRA